jgi:amino acid transporter
MCAALVRGVGHRYLNVQFPAVDPKTAAVCAYLIFMALNIAGVQIAASFELFVTLLAIFELLVFMGVVSPGFSMANFVKGGWAGQDTFSLAAIPGIFAAIPFAIWFSSRLKAWRWRRRKPKIRSAPCRLPTSPAS